MFEKFLANTELLHLLLNCQQGEKADNHEEHSYIKLAQNYSHLCAKNQNCIDSPLFYLLSRGDLHSVLKTITYDET